MRQFALLTFGKGKLPGKAQYRSAHHYDWIQIDSWSTDDSIENGLLDAYDKIQKVRSDCDIDNTNCDNDKDHIRILQSIVLMKDTEKDINEIQSSVIYISMINTAGSRSEDGKDIQKKIKEYFQSRGEKKETGLPVQIYSTLDHCDYVLLGNGDEISLEDYISLLKKLREESYIVDITTEYGIKGSLRYTSAITTPFTAFISSNGSDSGVSYDMLGHFDNISVCTNETWEKLNISINQQSKIHIGILHTENIAGSSQIEKSLQEVSENFWNYWNENFGKDMLLGVSMDESSGLFLYNALKELQYSIQTVLNHGYSRYYVLCFYESFYCFLKIIEVWKDIEDKDALFSHFNQYFSIIQALNASMLHSERRFTQADSFSMTCFDIPPKLIAYYTALASKMADAFSENNRYSFIFMPDFKKNTYVNTLMDYPCIPEYENIICIHISERNIYDITQTSLILAHEVAHHAAISDSERKQRYPYIIRCFFALLLRWSISSYDDAANHGEEIRNFLNDNKSFSAIIDALLCFFSASISYLLNMDYPDDSNSAPEAASKCLIHYADAYIAYIESKKTSEKTPEEIKAAIYYCTEGTRSLFEKMWNHLLQEDSKSGLFVRELGFQIHRTLKEDEFDCGDLIHNTHFYTNSTKDTAFCQELAAYYLADNLIKKFCAMQNVMDDRNMDIKKYEDAICYIFKEGYADLRALYLCYASSKEDDSLADSYAENICKENNMAKVCINTEDGKLDCTVLSVPNIEKIDRIRHWAVLLALLNKEPGAVFAEKTLRGVLIEDNEDHKNYIETEGIYYFYVLEQAVDFFKSVKNGIKINPAYPPFLPKKKNKEKDYLLQNVNDMLNTYCTNLENKLKSELSEQEN